MTRTALRAVGAIVASGLLLFAVPGCGGTHGTGTVTGVVTLNGEPLPAARVRFQPESGGAPAAAVTDEAGRYELRLSRSRLGAVTGEHVVEITTFRKGNPDAEPPKPAEPERLPRRYNVASELKATVQPGGNTVDFSLEATGKIPQPAKGSY
ncbi:MAG: hypothetical protein ACKOTB_12465 [Planctomycetia bacterium]